jgi:hypothetical protein
MFFQNLVKMFICFSHRSGIENALGLHRRGEVRSDGLTLIKASQQLSVEWRARTIHPWDQDRPPEERERLLVAQCYADTEAAIDRLFGALPNVDAIQFQVVRSDSDEQLLSGTIMRSARDKKFDGLTPRARLWQIGVRVFSMILMLSVGSSIPRANAQASQPSANVAQDSESTSTDLFVMIGSDFDRPGLVPRANYNIGIGHTFAFLKKDPIGDELTFGYTYENAGTHGFLHTDFGEHTESLGVMKNFGIPRTKVVTGYTWIQSGITSYTGYSHVLNRLDSGVSIGAIIHLSFNNSIWLQESYSKVVTVPWYTTSSVGYTYSW